MAKATKSKGDLQLEIVNTLREEIKELLERKITLAAKKGRTAMAEKYKAQSDKGDLQLEIVNALIEDIQELQERNNTLAAKKGKMAMVEKFKA